MKDQIHYHRVAEVPGLVLSTGRLSEFHFDRHYHLDYHIGLVSEGVQRQKFRGGSVLLGPGSIVLMPPGEIHDGTGEGCDAYTLKTFRVPVELFNQVAEELSGSSREPALAGMMIEDSLRAAHLVHLHNAMHAGELASPLALQSEWLSLLEFVFTQSKTIKPQDMKAGLSPRHFQRIKEYCVAHLAQKISLDELAAICGLGQFHFLRQFKQSIGMTPHAWLVRLRLEHACALLCKNPQSIAEVAHLVGFYDQSHFNRAFRQAFGVAPSSY